MLWVERACLAGTEGVSGMEATGRVVQRRVGLGVSGDTLGWIGGLGQEYGLDPAGQCPGQIWG